MYMTPKKRKILDFIKEFYEKRRYAPAIHELAKEFDVSVPTMWEHLEQLQGMGLIERKPFQKRAIEILER